MTMTIETEINMIEGGCLCGKVRYKIHITAPLAVGNCHCSTCQKQSGAPYVTVMFVPKQAMVVEGTVSSYQTDAESGNKMHRFFCARCSSPLFGQSTGTDKIRPILVSSVDDNQDILPKMNFWLSNAKNYTPIDDRLLAFDGQFTHFPK